MAARAGRGQGRRPFAAAFPRGRLGL